MFEDALQWVEKNVKEDADLEEFRKMIPDAQTLSKHPEIRPLIDSAISIAVNSHDKKFTEEKLPDIIKAEREKLIVELNPEETIEQKQLRETREKIEALEKRDRDNLRKAEIRKKSNELDIAKLGLTPEFFEPYALFGDDAIPTLEAFVQQATTSFTQALEKELASRLGTTAPKAGITPTGAAPKSMDEANALARTSPDAFAAIQAKIVAQEIEKAKTS